MSGRGYVLTIDVGTGSGRAVIFDGAGEQVSMGQREWLLEPIPEHAGAFNFNTDESWRLLVECIKEAIGKAHIDGRDIVGVTATSMREGMVLYDRQKKEIWACPNVDARSKKEVEEMVRSGIAEAIFKIGGDWLNIISPARFRWIKRNLPDIYRRIASMNMLSDWALFKLSGNIVTESTCGSSSGIFDLKQRSWSKELVEIADLPRDIYPPVYEPGTVIGKLTGEASALTGLREGIPVVAAGGDTQMAMVGTGGVRPGTFTLVAGTFWQATAVTDRALIDGECRLRTVCHALPGQWMIEGIGFFHGFIMRWFRDGFCGQEVKEAGEKGFDPYFLMEKLAERIPPGSNGIQALFSNIMNVRSWKHGVPSLVGFDIFNPEGCGKSACIRALEEHAAYTSRGHLEILRDISGYAPREITFCGGSSKGFLWPRIIADVLGLNVRIPHVREATSLGSFLCVAAALGWHAGIPEAVEKVVQWEQEIVPLRKNAESYNGHYARWRALYPYALSMADEGLLPHMWRAPGS
jgi:autoinducer 2 (AI-2) kinase